MRNLLVLSAAAFLLALGVSTQQAAALFPGSTVTGSQAFVQKVQQKGEEKGSVGAQSKDTGARTDSGQARGAVQSQGNKGGQARSGEDRARTGQRRSTNVDVNVNRGRHGSRNADVGVRRSYGYTAGAGNCKDIWRRYRLCLAR